MILDDGYADLDMNGIPAEFYGEAPSAVQRRLMLHDPLLRIMWNPKLKQWWVLRRIASQRPFRCADRALVGWMPVMHFPADVRPDMLADVVVANARARDRWRQGEDSDEKILAAQVREAKAQEEAKAAKEAADAQVDHDVWSEVTGGERVSVGHGGRLHLSQDLSNPEVWKDYGPRIREEILRRKGLDDAALEADAAQIDRAMKAGAP